MRAPSPALTGGWVEPNSGSLPPREVEWTPMAVTDCSLNVKVAASGLRLLLNAVPVISSALPST
jgi:hypothetical protein